MVRFLSGPLGEDQQVGAAIVEGGSTSVIFFWDPLEPHPDVDVRALLQIAVVYSIPIAWRSTADFLLSSPLMGTVCGGNWCRLVLTGGHSSTGAVVRSVPPGQFLSIVVAREDGDLDAAVCSRPCSLSFDATGSIRRALARLIDPRAAPCAATNAAVVDARAATEPSLPVGIRSTASVYPTEQHVGAWILLETVRQVVSSAAPKRTEYVGIEREQDAAVERRESLPPHA